MLPYAIFPLAAYLVGAIPVGYLLVRVLAGYDVRTVGSMSMGATNVARAVGARWFPVVFLFDFLKGLLPVFFLGRAAVDLGAPVWIGVAYGVAAVMGHNWPVWLGFRGGKGVATGAGAVTGVAPLAVAAAAVVFLLAVSLSRFISLGSMLAAIVLPPAYLLIYGRDASIVTLIALSIMALMIVFRHRGNLARILSGTEDRVGRRPEVEDA